MIGKIMFMSRSVCSNQYVSISLCCKVLFILFFLIMFFSTEMTFAKGAPAYMPDGAHPRIWMTDSLITEIKAKKAANTSEWLETLGRAGVFSTYNNASQWNRLDWPGGSGYAGSGFQDALMTWGLMYYAYKTPAYGTDSETAADVTARAYAQDAVSLIEAMILYFSAGEEEDGVDLVRINDKRYSFNSDEHTTRLALNPEADQLYRLLTYKNGYASRTAATALPIAFDWFFNDPLLTDNIKDKMYKIMFRHIDWVRGVRSAYNNGILLGGIRYHEDTDGDCAGVNNCNINDTNDHLTRRQRGYGFGVVGSNFNEAHSAMTMLIPLAVYGYAPQTDVDNYLTYARTLLDERLSETKNATKYKGGDSPEGIAYNSGWQYYLPAVLAYQEATGEDFFTGYAFPKEMAQNIIHNMYGSMDEALHRGAWSSSSYANWMKPVATPVNALTHILRDYYGEPTEGQRLQDYLNKATIPGGQSGIAWERFMWRDDANAIGSDYTQESLYYRAEGTGVVTLRSSWIDASDTILSQIILDGDQRQDHESYDDGQILLSRGSDHLLSRLKKVDITDDESAVGQNTLVFNDANSFPSGISDTNYVTPLAIPAIDKEAHTAIYDYISGEVGNSWRSPIATNLAEYFRRSVLFIRPNIHVVYDVAQSNAASGNTKKLYYQLEAAPTITGQNFNITVGSSKLFASVLYPAGVLTDSDISSTSNVNVATVFHRANFTPTTQKEYEQFLQVYEASDSATQRMTKNSLVTSVSGNMRGTYIEHPNDPAMNWVVMFTSDQSGNTVSGDVSYTLPVTYNTVKTSFPPTHILVDLVPNATYTVIAPVDKNVPQTYQLLQGAHPDKGKIVTSSNNGVLKLSPPMFDNNYPLTPR